jgi:hypothetical protein
MESVGFKEWAIVCAALGRGEQSIILRKGGIAEGREGFTFRHAEFFLFPTYFHEQVAKTRLDTAEIPPQRPGEIEIKFCAKMECSVAFTEWEATAALEPFHILQPEVVRERFAYDKAPGIHVAFVRVFRLEPSWIFPELPVYGGCRSWVKLPEMDVQNRMKSVLSDAECERRLREFRAVARLSGNLDQRLD